MKKCAGMSVGVIGCGKISDAYFKGAANAKNFKIKACADINLEAAEAKAADYNCAAMRVEELLSDSEIELVINLTIPKVHVEVGLKILGAGKHVYAEKPLAVNMDEATQLMAKAKEKGLRVGSAPDTFLFKGGQTAIKAVNDGLIGTPTSGTAFMRGFGPESWHPNPFFYYSEGGGPLLDMAPYYFTYLVCLLGPIKSVTAKSNRALNERVAGFEGIKGQIIPVTIETHYTGILEFESGALITVIMSFDTVNAPRENLTLNGTKGSLNIGDPNHFSDEPTLFRNGSTNWETLPFSHPDNQRAFGVIDMVDAIHKNRPHRASGELAYHILEAMLAFDDSAKKNETIFLKSKAEKPQPLPLGLNAWEI